MQFHPLQSSNLYGCHYDPARAVLTVKFNSGAIYAYDGVPQEDYDGLVNAVSAGSYLNDNIKGSYNYRRL